MRVPLSDLLPVMEFRRSPASRSGFLLPTIAVAVSLIMLATASGDALGGEPAAVVVRSVSLVFAVASLLVAYRILTARVRVNPEHVIVRNVLTTRTMSRAAVAGVVSPDETPAQWRPILQLRDGSKVKMFALARFKNRLFGVDQRSGELLERLATTLDVPLERPNDGGSTFRWG